MKIEQKLKSLLDRSERHIINGLNSIVDLSIPEATQLARGTMYITIGHSMLTIAKAVATLAEQTGAIRALLQESINSKKI